MDKMNTKTIDVKIESAWKRVKITFLIFMILLFSYVVISTVEAQSPRPANYKTQKLKKITWQKISNNLKRTPIPGGYLVLYNETAITFVPIEKGYNTDWEIYLPRKKRKKRK